MVDVSWGEPHEHESSVRLVSAKPAPQVFVSLGGARDCLGVDLHWVPELERSCPHMRTNCTWCHYPITRKVYVPVVQSPLYFQRSILSEPMLCSVPKRIAMLGPWVSRVVEIPASAFALVAKLTRERLFAIARGEGKLGKKVVFQVYNQSVEGIPPVFDVKPFLFKTWGINPSEYKP